MKPLAGAAPTPVAREVALARTLVRLPLPVAATTGWALTGEPAEPVPKPPSMFDPQQRTSVEVSTCLLYKSPSPRARPSSRMPPSA